MNNLIELLKYGQSYWLDNLTRTKITSGEIAKRVNEQGLRGITSNPSIFHKAFAEGNEYDAQIKSLAKAGKTAPEIYDALTVKDVQDACDILMPVYEKSDGTDGFVSLEVSPYLARDTEGTIKEARRLYKMVNKANCYIKIPGTKEGVPAIEQMLYEGVNINITLLFSIKRYEEVAKAYINAVKRRIEEKKPVGRTVSVASFFLSRIDVLVDQTLNQYNIPVFQKKKPKPESLFGKTGIASAKLAYQRYKQLFEGRKWEKFAKAGAHVQRLLWASTSTKDPKFSDVMYVDALIGPETVNTLPDKTIDAFSDHGKLKKNAIEDNLNKAEQVFSDLKHFDIDIDFITRQLEYEGVQKFIDAYDDLMKGLAAKRKKFAEAAQLEKVNG
ncbi:MAG: transaldolase [Chitinophagaceae bacterium]|nr:MAG: transaldolase [Chitinophagaceae bacterium]